MKLIMNYIFLNEYKPPPSLPLFLHSISHFKMIENLRMIIKAYYIVLDEQSVKDKDWPLDIGDLNFEFFFSFESCW